MDTTLLLRLLASRPKRFNPYIEGHAPSLFKSLLKRYIEGHAPSFLFWEDSSFCEFSSYALVFKFTYVCSLSLVWLTLLKEVSGLGTDFEISG